MSNPVWLGVGDRIEEEQGFSKSGWYFWDETMGHCHGPYETYATAAAAIRKYAEQLECVHHWICTEEEGGIREVCKKCGAVRLLEKLDYDPHLRAFIHR